MHFDFIFKITFLFERCIKCCKTAITEKMSNLVLKLLTVFVFVAVKSQVLTFTNSEL